MLTAKSCVNNRDKRMVLHNVVTSMQTQCLIATARCWHDPLAVLWVWRQEAAVSHLVTRPLPFTVCRELAQDGRGHAARGLDTA